MISTVSFKNQKMYLLHNTRDKKYHLNVIYLLFFLCLKDIFGSSRDRIGAKKGYYHLMTTLLGKHVTLKANQLLIHQIYKLM